MEGIANKEQILPAELSKDERDGFEGYYVSPENLLPVVKELKTQHGYDYLSSVTGVDYLPEHEMEVVYHLYRSLGGPDLNIKVRTPRDSATVPSLVSVYPGADFQEREAWDLLGIHFSGHPDLRRILMWEGFAGHPMRKDWQEPYFVASDKPFESRWPEGSAYRIEEKVPFAKNVQYAEGFDVESWTPESETALYAGVQEIANQSSNDFDTQRLVVNLGPQHPSTHGVFRMVVALEGETIVDLKPVMGYLHRNHEKIGERNTYIMNMPFTDRLDYLTSMGNNFGYALAVEKLMGIKPTERADYIRVIMAELTRIISHLFAIGAFLNDLGAFFTPMLYALRERELILDVFESVSGSRMMCNYFRFGGVVRDIPAATMTLIHALVFERLPKQIDDLDTYLTKNEIVRSRSIGVGVLSAEDALAYSAAGPVLRASGIPYDVRRADPYSIYDRFDFDIPTARNGDSYDRYIVRLEEIRQSIRIVQQALRDIPAGEVMAVRPQYQPKVPAGEAYGRVENPKGELGYYLVSDGSPHPWRYHVRAPSFINLTSLSTISTGHKIADVVVILGSLDIVLGEVDR